MTVVHVLDHSWPVVSGYALRSLRLLRAQRARGIRPVVVTSPKHEEDRPSSSAVETIEGVPHWRSPAVTGPPWLREHRIVRTLERTLRAVVERERPIAIHAHSPMLDGMAALRVGRRLGVPVVYEVRAFWEDAAVEHGHFRPGSARYRLVRALETRVCRRADRVAVLCAGLAEDLVARGIARERISIAPNGVDADEFRPPPSSADPAGRHGIAFLGSFYRYEGLHLLVEAVAALVGRRPDLRAWLAGAGPERPALEALVRRRGLEEHVHLPGAVAPDEVRRLYGQARAVVYPRTRSRLTELVTPLKPLEAMAMGTPVIASDVGGHREITDGGRAALLFPAGDARALAAAIDSVLEDDTLAASLAARGRAWASTSAGWDRAADAHERMYAALGTRS